MNTYYELGANVRNLLEHLRSNDENSISAISRHMKDIVRRMDDKTTYSPMQLSIVFSDILKISVGSAQELALQGIAVRQVRDIYGEYNLTLGDLYASLSDIMTKKHLYGPALEWAGQALVVRAHGYGIMHDKTADSHFSLGILYRLLGLYEKSRQELYISRGIRSKLHTEEGLSVALCDLHIGYTEMALVNTAISGNHHAHTHTGTNNHHHHYNQFLTSPGTIPKTRDANIVKSSQISGYIAFYRCFHTRYLRLGSQDPLTLEAEEQLLTHNSLGGERLVSALELKLRINELQWTCTNTSNWLYSVALFVGRLSVDDALTLKQVRQLVASAIQFSVTRLSNVGSSTSTTGTGTESGIQEISGSPTTSPRHTRSAAATSTAVPSSPSKVLSSLSLGDSQDPEQEQIHAITAMLMMIPKPFIPTAAASSPSKRGAAGTAGTPTKASPLPAAATGRILPKLRVQTHSSTEDGSTSADNSPHALGRDRDHFPRSPQLAWQFKLPTTTTTAVATEVHTGNNNDDHTTTTTIEAQNQDQHDNITAEPENQSVAVLELETNNSQEKTETEETETPSKFQSKLIATESDSSPTRSPLPENWRPVKSAYSSLAWTSCHHIQSVDFALGLAETIYARDTEGILLVLRRALGDSIEEAQRNEQLLLKQNQRKSLRKSSTTSSNSTKTSISKRKSIENNAGNDPKAALNALFGKRNSGAATPAGDDKEAGDPKAKLNALFSKQLGGPPSGTQTGGAASSSKGPVWGSEIPTPPPVPTCWPPLPYTPDAPGSTGEGAADASLSAAVTTSTIVNADGTVVTITIPVAAPPPKPKLKQVYLVGLPSVEGTLWETAEEELIPAEELFDDLEAEFTLDKPKSKKPTPFGGNSAGKGLKSTGLMSSKSTTEEVVLDAQRAQNINIMLAKFGKKSYFDLAQSILAFDAETVGSSALASLSAFTPTTEECSKVSAFVLKKYASQLALLEEQKRKEQKQEGNSEENPNPTEETVPSSATTTTTPTTSIATSRPGSRRQSVGLKLPAVTASQVNASVLNKLKLGKAEQFIFVFSQVSKLEMRLSAMSSVLSAQEMSDTVVYSAETMLTAVTEVRGSGRLKFLLRAFLDLNNALCKAAKSQEKVVGIKLESLTKITQTKTNSGDTAEQYVVNKISKHFPDALKVSADMPTIEAARGVVFPQLVAALRKLEEGIALMKTLIEYDTTTVATSNSSSSGSSSTTAASSSGTTAVASSSVTGTVTADSTSSAAISTTNLADSSSTDVPPPTSTPTTTNTTSTTTTSTTVDPTPPPSREEKSKIQTYLETSEALYSKASKQLHEAQRDFSELCVYFGEESSVDPEKLFGQISQFIKGIQNAATVAEVKLKKKARPQIKLPNMIN